MSNVLKDLARIEVDNELLAQVDMPSIISKFDINYRRLDELREFRADHEKRNFFSRLWNSGKLRDAQLDSAEVQAEFGKSIGQLTFIGILQAKELGSQQESLNRQQARLKAQAEGLERNTNQLKEQQECLSQQSQELKKLIEDYFELKGLTEKGAQKLISIASEVRSTKEALTDEFASRVAELLALEKNIQAKISALEGDVSGRIKRIEDFARAAAAETIADARDAILKVEQVQKVERETLRAALAQAVQSMDERHTLVAQSVNAVQESLSNDVQSLERAFQARSRDFEGALRENSECVKAFGKKCEALEEVARKRHKATIAVWFVLSLGMLAIAAFIAMSANI